MRSSTCGPKRQKNYVVLTHLCGSGRRNVLGLEDSEQDPCGGISDQVLRSFGDVSDPRERPVRGIRGHGRVALPLRVARILTAPTPSTLRTS